MWKKLQQWLDRKSKGDKDKLQREEIEFLPAALEVVETPPSPTGRAVLWTLFVLLAVIFIWVMVGHVDEIAVANGKIIPNGEVKVVQAEDKGVIKSIHVTEGQLVKKGDLLVELDTTMTEADVNNVRHQVAYYRLDIERLLAEQGNLPFTAKPQDGLEDQDILYQQNLYNSRMAEYRSKLAVAQSNMMQMQAGLNSAQAVTRPIF
jgi:hemolysin D